MSRLRKFVRIAGKEVLAAFPQDMELIRQSRDLGTTLQSFHAALGASPSDFKRGAVRFANRYYFTRDSEQASLLRRGDCAQRKVKAAVLERLESAGVKARFSASPTPGVIMI